MLQRAYDLAGAGDELLAAGRPDERRRALSQGGRARARRATSCSSGRASRSPRRGELEAGTAKVRQAIEHNPNWQVLLERLSPEFAPAGEAVRAQL